MQYKIGKLIADNLVEDGSTLQAGIGVIPDAVMANLKGHKGLGVHSEMFSDGMIDLIQSGAITNEFVGVTDRSRWTRAALRPASSWERRRRDGVFSDS